MKEILLIAVLIMFSVGCAHLLMQGAITYVNHTTQDRTQNSDLTFYNYPLTATE